MKSGNLNFLEPSGPLQACNGTALPLPVIISASYIPNAVTHTCLVSFLREMQVSHSLACHFKEKDRV